MKVVSGSLHAQCDKKVMEWDIRMGVYTETQIIINTQYIVLAQVQFCRYLPHIMTELLMIASTIR